MVQDEARDAARPLKHLEFHVAFLTAALAVAIFGGFAIATYLALALGFGLPLGSVYPALIQAHGHAQLLGWAGLFIIGVSLHFVPRLASVPIARPRWIGCLLWLIIGGLIFRLVGQPALALLPRTPASAFVAWLVAASGGLEEAGILLYLVVLLPSVRGVGDPRTQPAFAAVRPYLGATVAGWFVYASLDFLLVLDLAERGAAVVNFGWDRWIVQSFIALVLLPAAMAHSVRLLPMVLALPTPRWPVRGTAYAYLVGVGLQLIASALPLLGVVASAEGPLSSLGLLIKGGVLLWFVWQLDVLTRLRPVDRPARFLRTGPDRPPTRPGLPDFGEFGRFERLVYSAYAWLVLAAISEMVNGGATLLGRGPLIADDPIRHMYLLGFITLLILGVSVRMLPGFLGQKAVASPALVEGTYWLGNAATICRVLPPLLPAALFAFAPAAARAAQFAFAFSGLLGLCAVLCLAGNLWRTVALAR